MRSFNSVNQSLNQSKPIGSIGRSFIHTLILALQQSFNQLINQPAKQSIHQSLQIKSNAQQINQ